MTGPAQPRPDFHDPCRREWGYCLTHQCRWPLLAVPVPVEHCPDMVAFLRLCRQLGYRPPVLGAGGRS